MGNIPKKHLILSVLSCFAISAGANAATIENLTLNAGQIKIDGTSDTENVSYKIYKNGDTETDINNICEMGEANVSNGRFSITLSMPDTMNGNEVGGLYTVDVMGSEKASVDFEFVAFSLQKAFIDKVNQASSASETEQLFNDKTDADNLLIMKSLGADTDYYSSLSEGEKADLSALFFSEKGDDEVTPESFGKIFKQAETTQYLKKNKADTDWLNDRGFSFEETSYNDIKDEKLRTWIADVLSGGDYGSYSDIEKKYSEANILYIINNAKYTGYDDLLDKYDSVLGITSESYYSDYLKMSQSEKSNVNSKVRDALTRSPAKSIAELSKTYDTAVSNVKKASNNSGGGSSNSGGGSGGSRSGNKSNTVSGTGIIVPEIADPTKERPDFTDLDDVEWAREAIEALADKGIVSGYDKNTFGPLCNIKREEFVKMVISALGYDINAKSCPFTDVETSAWYAPFVYEAYARGIINGVSEEEFGIGAEIKREDMAVIIDRIVPHNDIADKKAPFSDDTDIAGYAKEAVYRLYNSGKVAGVGNDLFGPKMIVNRAQAAKIIYDTIVNVK